jgi:hypothetical protein
MTRLMDSIRSSLTPDLLKGQWKEKASGGVSGHCYIAAEALFHLLGGKASGYLPTVLSNRTWSVGLDPGETHWFLMADDGSVLDPTSGQFDCEIPYSLGKRTGFLTRGPSRRARTIMERVNNDSKTGTNSHEQSVKRGKKTEACRCVV